MNLTVPIIHFYLELGLGYSRDIPILRILLFNNMKRSWNLDIWMLHIKIMCGKLQLRLNISLMWFWSFIHPLITKILSTPFGVIQLDTIKLTGCLTHNLVKSIRKLSIREVLSNIKEITWLILFEFQECKVRFQPHFFP